MSDAVNILIIDDDRDSQHALRQILDSEGWHLKIVPLASQGLAELAKGDWTLVIVNVALTDTSGAHFETLCDLGRSAVQDQADSGRRARVLFLVPELAGPHVQPALEREQLPYTLKPFHLHDFLERVSDLLLEAGAISEPIRHMVVDPLPRRQRTKEKQSVGSRPPAKMFASRGDYEMTEEEIAEFEKTEKEEVERKKKKKEQDQNPDRDIF
ncbi:MAG: response regulator [Candidatus Acidiferrales bacterium]